jgi:hypothetical protein
LGMRRSSVKRPGALHHCGRNPHAFASRPALRLAAT